MIALLFTAVLSSAAADRQVLVMPPVACREVAQKVADTRQETLRKLGELPAAQGEYAVMRKVEGCMVAAPIGYHPRPLRSPLAP